MSLKEQQKKKEPGILQALMPGANIRNSKKILVSLSTSDDTRVFNVGGTRFETYYSTLRRLLDTRLTDENFLKRHYREDKDEYFFDRDPEVFKAVLQYLRTGELHFSASKCGATIKAELEFWGLDEGDIEDCCWLHYNSWSQTLESLRKLEEDRKVSMGRYDFDPHKTGRWQSFKNHGWQLLNNPAWSIWSKLYGTLSVIMVLLSIFSFVSQTHEFFQITKVSNNNTNTTTITSQSIPWSQDNVHPLLYAIDALCFAFFILEIISRFTCCPNKLKFFLRPINIIDFLALVPDIVVFCYLAAHAVPGEGVVLFVSLLRIARVFRIFRLMRHFPGLWTLGYTVKSSLNELMLMFVFLMIAIMVYASLIYHVEDRDNFTSIPQSFWWAIITMTTVGYGDFYPVTKLGYLVGSITAITGMLLMAFIVPVLVSNFILYYNHTECALDREKRREKRLQRERRKQKLMEKLKLDKNDNLLQRQDSSSPMITKKETLTNGSSVYCTEM